MKCSLVGSPTRRRTFRSGITMSGSASFRASIPRFRALVIRCHAFASTSAWMAGRTSSVSRSRGNAKLCSCTRIRSRPPGTKRYMPAIGSHIFRTSSGRWASSASRIVVIAAAVSSTVMVMAPDAKHCRNGKVKGAIAAQPGRVLRAPNTRWENETIPWRQMSSCAWSEQVPPWTAASVRSDVTTEGAGRHAGAGAEVGREIGGIFEAQPGGHVGRRDGFMS